MRLNKFIAKAGICSRRAADQLIKAGLIEINGTIITNFAYQVKITDKVKYNKQILNIKQTRLYAFNKPKACLTSSFDSAGRKIIYEYLPKNLQNFSPIGRLDYNSEGLLLLTNDGALKRHYELPKHKIIRKYKVRIFGELQEQVKKQIESGITIDKITYQKCQIEIIKKGTNSWLEISLTEGKNREIRKIFEFFGHPVSRLIRTSYGKYKLQDLALGAIKELDI
ncbi:MAG: pseudouridine synthase [Rickettsiales bacterium]